MLDSDTLKVIVRWIAVAAISGATGMASHRVEDADEVASHEEGRAERLALKEEIKLLREGMAQRIEREETEKDVAIERLQRRVTWLEAKLDISAPAAAEAAAPPR